MIVPAVIADGGMRANCNQSVVKVSRAGSQISKILLQNNREALKRIGLSIKDNVTIEIAKVISRSGASYNYKVLETVKA